MEVETIPDCVFTFWDQKDFKGRLFELMENSLLLSNSEFNKMQNEEKARKFIKFLFQEDVGSIRNATTREEFVMCVKTLPFQWKSNS